MPATQIYALVNSVAQQAFGGEITVTNLSDLIALGDTVLSSSANTETFFNVLVSRIGRTIFSYREYRNSFKDMVIDDMQYGAIVQKIKMEMPDAVEDEAYELQDGESIDMYKINKPKVKQSLFTKITPYKYYITIAETQLQDAFTSESGITSLIGMIFGKVRNKIEMVLERLAISCMNNMIAEVSGTDREIHLVTEYNADSGKSLTNANCLNDDGFLRFCIERIKTVSMFMTKPLDIFNDGSLVTFTPFENQRLFVLTKLQKKLETVVQYAAFHKDYVSLQKFKEVPFLQSPKNPLKINVNKASDSSPVELDNIVAVVCDDESFGVYQKKFTARTTPLNASGLYYNVFYHLRELYFNDLSENFVIFTLS